MDSVGKSIVFLLQFIVVVAVIKALVTAMFENTEISLVQSFLIGIVVELPLIFALKNSWLGKRK